MSRDFYFSREIEPNEENLYRRATSTVRRIQHRRRAIEYSIAARRARSDRCAGSDSFANTFRNANGFIELDTNRFIADGFAQPDAK